MIRASTDCSIDPRSLPLELFTPIDRCRACDGIILTAVSEERLDFSNMLADPDLGPILGDYDGYRFALNKCRACGFMQPAAIPSRPNFFDAIYNLKSPDGWMEEEFVRGYKDGIFRTILKGLERRLGPSRRALLDVGCHVGRMIELARQSGWRPEGIELNAKAAKFAASRTGLPVHRTNAKDFAATGSRFDAVVLTDVLEHIPDPVPLLADLRALLNPSGWVAIKVPCGTNQLLKQRIRYKLSKRHDPGIATNYVHVNHFGPRSLTTTLGRAGFDSVEVGIGTPELIQGSGVTTALTNAFRKAVYGAACFFRFGAHSPLAMNLQAFARNPVA
jgi:SAM-dependent methyltransferase